MFGIGETELLIIVAFGFMIFGPDKLPGMGRTIGRALRQFREAQEGFTEVVQTEVMDPLQEAMGDPLEGGTRKKRRATVEERAAALAQDADLEGATDGAPRKETFAERKQRLEAERKAREEQQRAAAIAADGDVPAPAPEEAPKEAEPAQPEPAPRDTSAAALYAMGGSSSFAAARQKEAEKAQQEAAEKAAEAEAEAQEEPAAQAAPEAAPAEAPADPAEPNPTTDGKEAGEQEA